jgi:hypothetical protein
MSAKKFAVEMTILEARALIDVVGRAEGHEIIEKDEAGPIDWVMTRINKKLIETLDENWSCPECGGSHGDHSRACTWVPKTEADNGNVG